MSAAIDHIHRVYQAFAAADLPALLAAFTPDAEIRFQGASPDVPWHGPHRGIDDVTRFFATIAELVEFQAFEPGEICASDAAVAVQVKMRFRVKRTGRIVDQLQVHWWRLRDGKVSSIDHFEDTAQVIAATR